MVKRLVEAPKDHSKRSDWWFIDRSGRKIGYLWPEDFRSIIDSIWGRQQSVPMFSRYAGFTTKTVYDWCRGDKAIPKDVAQLVTCMQVIILDKQAHKKVHPWRDLPKLEADWLPKERQDPSFEVKDKPFG